ncbi:MAG: response regulator, partial [bacterium]
RNTLMLRKERVELRRIVAAAVETSSPMIKHKEHKLELELPPDPVIFMADPVRLAQVIANLLDNAAKYTEPGGRITVEASADGREAVVRVRDTGIGIAPEVRERLFQSFTQVDASTTRRYGGTGLGLAISRRVVEMMGGWIWLESVPGQGTTFHFTLEAEPAEVAHGVARGPQPPLVGKRLLVVDDNATNRRILSLMTESWGMEPRNTGSPLEALAWVRGGEAFDIALLDMQMPELDGLQLASALRELRDARALPVVLLTSLGHLDLGEGSPELAAVLIKPVKASHLFETLVGVLSGLPTWRRGVPDRPTFDATLGQRMPLRILVAEDNAVNQRLALLSLERMGYRGDVAANGWEAVQAMERQPYDIILMDVQMPELDGLAATRLIRRRSGGAGHPPFILAMTANALREDREACLEAGMDDYLSKPVRVGELQAALERWGQQVSNAALEKAAPTPPASAFSGPTLAELRGMRRKDGRTMLDRLLELFEEGTPRLLGDLKKAIARGDDEAAGFAAHALKGSALGLGALAVAELAGQLEAAARAGTLGEKGTTLSDLEQACAEALAEAGRERSRQEA